MIYGKSVTIVFMSLSVMVGAATAQEPEPPRVISWSNSNTADKETVFLVQSGKKVTYTVKAEGADKYVWLVNGVIQQGANAASFKWTVPDKKGIWKICVKTTNKPQIERADGVMKSHTKWTEKIKDKEKEIFIWEMTDIRAFPLKARKEWIVSTFLKSVKPGESIQKAVHALPVEGGIIKLAAGVHDVKEPIIINRGNVVIYGADKSEIRAHDPSRDIFCIPDECRGAANKNEFGRRNWKNKPLLENLLFKGFKVTSTYRKSDRGVAIIEAWNVKNLTVEDILDLSSVSAAVTVNPLSSRRGPRSENIIIRRNVFHSPIVILYSKPIFVLDNGFEGSRAIIHIDHMNGRIHVGGNYVDSTGGQYTCMVMDAGRCYDVWNNVFIGNWCGIKISGGGRNYLISNNIIKKGTRSGIYIFEQFGVKNVAIKNNLIYSNNGPGIHATEPGWSKGRNKFGEACIINNIIYSNAGDGVEVQTGITLDIRNNIIARNGGCTINNTGTGRVILNYNNLWSNKAGNFKGAVVSANNIGKNPLFADFSRCDFHLKSKAGRWDPKAKKWVKDNVHSPCIDAGDPKTGFSKEPASNGGRANMGAYGNTSEASKSILQK